MKRYEYYMILQEKYTDINVFSEIERTCRKIEEHFETHNNILVSVSGGSDSDCIVHLVCTYFPEFLEKCKFVFVNTGIEYDATKRHLCDLEKRYGITVDRIRGKSVVTVIREYGVPILIPGTTEKPGLEYKYYTNKATGRKRRQPLWYYEALNARTAEERRRIRSKTFPGIAKAMAEQWG